MYVFLSDINTKLQLFYFTAKYFMLKFFSNFASSACSFFFCILLFIPLVPPSLYGRAGVGLFFTPSRGKFCSPVGLFCYLLSLHVLPRGVCTCYLEGSANVASGGSSQLSTVNCQLSTVNYQLSTVNCQLSTVNYFSGTGPFLFLLVLCRESNPAELYERGLRCGCCINNLDNLNSVFTVVLVVNIEVEIG